MTNAISFFMFQIGICLPNYLDDLASAESPDKALFSFNTIRAVLQKCCIEEAQNKAYLPSTVICLLQLR